jgi:Family of unknown function (DUF5908)
MPIEIKELHIRVAVNAAPPGSAPPAAKAPGAGAGGADRDAIVAECVEQVLDILQGKKER